MSKWPFLNRHIRLSYKPMFPTVWLWDKSYSSKTQSESILNQDESMTGIIHPWWPMNAVACFPEDAELLCGQIERGGKLRACAEHSWSNKEETHLPASMTWLCLSVFMGVCMSLCVCVCVCVWCVCVCVCVCVCAWVCAWVCVCGGGGGIRGWPTALLSGEPSRTNKDKESSW